MRRFLTLSLTLLAAAACADQPTQPAISDLDAALHRGSAPAAAPARASGGAYAAAHDLYLSFTGVETPAGAQGAVNYRHAATGNEFQGAVTCIHQEGNEAGLSGTVNQSNFGGPYFFVEVIDNGEGDMATGPDRFRVRLADTPWDCAALSHSYPAAVTDGNIDVQG